jgi:phosphoglycerate dehydrogenase-like enzyme
VSPARTKPVITVLCGPDGVRPGGLERVAELAELRYVDAAGLADGLAGARALFLWDFFSTAVADSWPAAAGLDWIHVAAAGVDSLLFDELVESSITVTNARGTFDRPIAEFVLTSILDHLKGVQLTHEQQRARTWRHRETLLAEGRTVLIIGTGPIGRATARLLRAVGFEVRGAGRTGRDSDPDFGTVVPSGSLVNQVGWADHVVAVAPLTPETRHLLDAPVFAAMKPTAQVINVGRGPLIDEGALLTALGEGRIAAAALDVFATEPLPDDHPLWTTPGVVVSPHLSGDVVGWRDTLADQFADIALRWLAGQPLFNVVDKRRGYVTVS